jgi:hypothetical protein
MERRLAAIPGSRCGLGDGVVEAEAKKVIA